MDIPVKRIPLRDDFRADPAAMAAAIDDDTMMMVGSALYFPHGVIMDISMLSPVAAETGVWLHVDACVGGYLTPFAKRLGREVADFDFAIPGVRSISADLHKFGFAPKTIVNRPLPVGRGFSAPNFRPRSLDLWSNDDLDAGWYAPRGAHCRSWAVFKHLGIDGYTTVARSDGDGRTDTWPVSKR